MATPIECEKKMIDADLLQEIAPLIAAAMRDHDDDDFRTWGRCWLSGTERRPESCIEAARSSYVQSLASAESMRRDAARRAYAVAHTALCVLSYPSLAKEELEWCRQDSR